jgi:hypothetical protein
LSLLYFIKDTLLAIAATTLLLNFWGGQFSRTWTLIAIGALMLYIADIRYAYVITRSDYIYSIVDVFWTFSALFIGAGAAWEYDLSKRSRLRRR